MKAEQFMIQFSKLDVEQKTETIVKMSKHTLSKATPNQLRTFEALKSWCSVNVMVGDDLCEPSLKSLRTFLKK